MTILTLVIVAGAGICLKLAQVKLRNRAYDRHHERKSRGK